MYLPGFSWHLSREDVALNTKAETEVEQYQPYI
jgi:hypothetical protein